ncbi:hypothetical protein M8998_06245 [Sphingobacterium sp. lm-10]|uniref:TetR/AcrR family transcriptional regulator n=1 Tax=Sphingobacterium sp. lm-10 TaxID=2944904 RepID=UPI0020215B09|nr:hypothetical protein [Sphingobacterium sp. lm-10]MCL7987533.1 hypothetical protein [Sphingobacterium sp. lm-10]
MMKRKRSASTKAKMLRGVEDILKEAGCNKINVAYISTFSGIDRKLLYYHFGSFSNMVTEFLRLESMQFKEKSLDVQDEQALPKYLEQRMNTLFNNPLLGQLLVWELSDRIPALEDYASQREKEDIEFMKKVLPASKDVAGGADMQAVFALLLGGIHYLSAYSHHNTKPFFGMNFNEEPQRKRLLDLLTRMLLEIK